MSRMAASRGSGRKQGQPFGMGFHTATEMVLTFASGQELCLGLPATRGGGECPVPFREA